MPSRIFFQLYRGQMHGMDRDKIARLSAFQDTKIFLLHVIGVEVRLSIGKRPRHIIISRIWVDAGFQHAMFH